MRTKRFQNRITAGRFTLPTAILISVSCWILTAVLLPETETQQSGYSLWETFCDFCIPTWANRLFSFILYAVIGYFLIQLNNTFAIIRMRASVQTSVYFLLISVCPSLHMLYAGDLAAASFLVALFFLFKSYQQAQPTGSLFHAFVFIGLGSLLFPQLMLFVPIFWIGARVKVTKYPNESMSLNTYYNGMVLGEIWGYETAGIAKSDEENLFTLTGIAGMFDPEATAANGWSSGKTYPLSQTFSFGLNLTL